MNPSEIFGNIWDLDYNVLVINTLQMVTENSTL